MDTIHEISAAPHLPSALKTALPAMRRPEYLAGWLMLLVEDHRDVEFAERDGELYLLPRAGN